jgi:Plasmid pRiA4b ORF-3-like protein
VVEARSELAVGLKFAVCVDGQNACPPEDVGGVSGYARFVEAISDPLDEEHDDYLVWVGHKFDPAAFSLATANAALQRVR